MTEPGLRLLLVGMSSGADALQIVWQVPRVETAAVGCSRLLLGSRGSQVKALFVGSLVRDGHGSRVCRGPNSKPLVCQQADSSGEQAVTSINGMLLSSGRQRSCSGMTESLGSSAEARNLATKRVPDGAPCTEVQEVCGAPEWRRWSGTCPWLRS